MMLKINLYIYEIYIYEITESSLSECSQVICLDLKKRAIHGQDKKEQKIL